jgi:hypothetical protein
LYADPVIDGHSRECGAQVAVDVADALRAEVRHQARRFCDRDGSNKRGVLFSCKHFDAIVAEALTRVVLVRRPVVATAQTKPAQSTHGLAAPMTSGTAPHRIPRCAPVARHEPLGHRSSSEHFAQA